MTVINRAGRLKKLGEIENGCLFKTGCECYIATDEFDDYERLCVNVESGIILKISTSRDIETLDYASIELTGRG